MTFCLFKIATQGVSLWHFHVYMFYNLNRFILFFFYLSPFLTMVSTGLKTYIHSYIESTSAIFTFLNFLLLPSPSYMWPPINVTCFS
jgi:hypothetical protein